MEGRDAALNRQAIEAIIAGMGRIEDKLDDHVTEGIEVHKKIAVLEIKVGTLTKLVWAIGGAAIAILVETAIGFVTVAGG